MSTQPVAHPSVPPKPFRVSRWLLAGTALFGLLYLIISFVHLPGSSSGNKQKAEPNTTLATASDVSTFTALNRQNLIDLQQKRALMQQELLRAGLTDETAAADIVNHLPTCNVEERQKLNGQNYVAVNQQTKQVVQFACETDNTWHPLPAAAGDIQAPTLQQMQQIRAIRTSSGGRGGDAGTSAKDKAAQALEKALNSSSVVEFVSAAALAGNSETATAKGAQNNTAVPVVDRKTEGGGDSRDVKHLYDWDSATGPLYHLFEGDVIEAILTNRLAGEFTGPVNVMVTTNLYSHNHQHILLPQGTRILGEASKVSLSGQRRLAVTFHRAITPDGYSVDLEKFGGLDQQGASGLTGRVDTHWPKVIATAALIGAIGGLSEIGGTGIGYNPLTSVRVGVGEQTGQEATQILNHALNVLPTVTVYEGTRVRIWVMRDMQLPAYENHTVNPNL